MSHTVGDLGDRLIKWLDRHTDVEEWSPCVIALTHEAFCSIIELWLREKQDMVPTGPEPISGAGTVPAA